MISSILKPNLGDMFILDELVYMVVHYEHDMYYKMWKGT